MSKVWQKFYPSEIPYEIEEPQTSSVYELFESAYKKAPQNNAVIENDTFTTFEQLKQLSDALASVLYKGGFKKGDRLALMLPNTLEYVITFFAVQRLGGTIVQVNPAYQAPEVENIVNDSESTWFVGHVDEKEKLAKLEMLDKVSSLFVGGEGDESFENATKVENIIKLPRVEIDREEDVAVFQYTGGTTGLPKGAMLTHKNIIFNLMQTYTFGKSVYSQEGNIFLGISPMFHAMGMTNMVLTLWIGGTYIPIKKFNIEEVIQLMRKYRPTLFTGSPTMYIGLLNHPMIEKDDFSSLRLMVSGSAPMPIEVIRQLRNFTDAPFIEGYGLSEATTSATRNPIGGVNKVGSIGIPIPSTDVKVVDLETGEKEVPFGEEGELIIKGPQVMKGYWNNEAETKIALRNGWLYTGDIATMDEDGYLYIAGRKKEMIIAGGYNIYPIEIENVIYEHPKVKEAVVYGVKDEYLGEKIKAVIVTNSPATEEEILDWCNERLARYKVPRIVEFRDELPKTEVGKILRRKLIEEEQSK